MRSIEIEIEWLREHRDLAGIGVPKVRKFEDGLYAIAIAIASPSCCLGIRCLAAEGQPVLVGQGGGLHVGGGDRCLPGGGRG